MTFVLGRDQNKLEQGKGTYLNNKHTSSKWDRQWYLFHWNETDTRCEKTSLKLRKKNYAYPTIYK